VDPQRSLSEEVAKGWLFSPALATNVMTDELYERRL
jgi:hypothetical protein